MKVLLTRPDGENEVLATLLRAAGPPVGEVCSRPMLRLSDLSGPDSARVKSIAMNLDQYDKIIFVSKSSVRFGLPVLASCWPQWPVTLEWLAVGPGTARALEPFGINAGYPEPPGSEGLLRLLHPSTTQPIDQRILIARGKGGRELLFDELARRGARVEYWEVYHRSTVIHDDLQQLIRAGQHCVVVLTSVEILTNFVQQAGALVRRCIAVVSSDRVAIQAIAYPFIEVVIAGEASHQSLYDAIIRIGSRR